jgi:outer membrane protein assembly factor BamE (lipoprotein component of BamABCDE complex)
MKCWASLLCLGLAFCFFACSGPSSKVTSENYGKITTGMTKVQVEELIGKPTRMESGELLGIEGATYYYSTRKAEVKVVFVNDSVVSKDGSFK